MKPYLILLSLVVICTNCSGQLLNFDRDGRQLIRLDSLGNSVDAHDGEIALFDGVYYLYGTSYDCGYQWGNKEAPFCGFKVYTSHDLVKWQDKGFLFDAKTELWQTRCNGKTYGCYRPHVVYNASTKKYVLWINVYDNQVGYRVFTSPTPLGPFTEVAEPKLAVNTTMPVAGLNNGDHDTFIDDDGTAYLAYTDWRAKGAIVIEQLTADYLSGTGKHVLSVTAEKTEAPCLFKRKDLYYIIYSDPNCGYCSGTGTSYKTAKSPLGPWSEGIRISDSSCGGQPSFVSVFKAGPGDQYLYGSDLWNNAAKNEALANFYWTWLKFTETGAIEPLECKTHYGYGKPSEPVTLPTTGFQKYNSRDDINATKKYAQSFVAANSGMLESISIVLFKNNYPDSNLVVELYNAGPANLPVGAALKTISISPEKMGWSPRNMSVPVELRVKRGSRYSIVLRTNTSKGNYGCVANRQSIKAGETLAVSSASIKTFTPAKSGQIKFSTVIR